MVARVVLRLLMLIALVLAPVAMARGHAPVAPTPVSATAAHCAAAGEQERGDAGRAAIDCAIACAVVLPQMPSLIAVPVIVPVPAHASLARIRGGMRAAAELPPPRDA